MWYNRLQINYDGDFEQFQAYDETYGIAQWLGFESAEAAWEADPLIKGSVNPKDLAVVTDPAEILNAGIEKVKQVKEDYFGEILDKDMESILDILEAPRNIKTISPND